MNNLILYKMVYMVKMRAKHEEEEEEEEEVMYYVCINCIFMIAIIEEE